jgi:hypothetical protein
VADLPGSLARSRAALACPLNGTNPRRRQRVLRADPPGNRVVERLGSGQDFFGTCSQSATTSSCLVPTSPLDPLPTLVGLGGGFGGEWP